MKQVEKTVVRCRWSIAPSSPNIFYRLELRVDTVEGCSNLCREKCSMNVGILAKSSTVRSAKSRLPVIVILSATCGFIVLNVWNVQIVSDCLKVRTPLGYIARLGVGLYRSNPVHIMSSFLMDVYILWYMLLFYCWTPQQDFTRTSV